MPEFSGIGCAFSYCNMTVVMALSNEEKKCLEFPDVDRLMYLYVTVHGY